MTKVSLPPVGPASAFQAAQSVRSLTRPAFSAVSPLFGAQQDAIKTGKQRNLLLPSGTPIFFLHGTSSDGLRMRPMVHWLQRDVRTEHPVYVAQLPEVETASGIETVLDPGKNIPAALAVLRDMGDFRFQVVNTRLRELDHKLGESCKNDQALADFFQLRPDEAAALAPIIKDKLIKPIYHVPAGWHPVYRLPLSQLTSAGMGKIANELNKLSLRPDETKLAIYDSAFLATKAELEGKELNFRTDRIFNDPETINVRSINLRDVALLEGYLLSMQNELGDGLKQAWRKQAQDAGRRYGKEDDLRAERTAEKLMDVIAPRSLSIGHSQGGTVLMTALLNYLKDLPSPNGPDFQKKDPRGFTTLAGRGIGVELLLSAPLKGIPDVPVWGKKIQERVNDVQDKIPLLRRKEGMLAHAVKRAVWWGRRRNKPAVDEMREGSPVAKKIQSELNRLDKSGKTVISAFDWNDSYIEPEASLLQDGDGKHPQNVFHVGFATDQLPPYYTGPDDMVESFTDTVPLVGGALAKLVPKKLKQYIYNFYAEEIINVEQHRATVTFPDFISQELGQQLLGNAKNQLRVLDTRNFEPLRYQSLIARGKSLQRRCLDLPTKEGAAVLQEFIRQHPTFLNALIENIQENIPTVNSASYQAHQLLSSTFTLMQRIAADPQLKTEYAKDLQANLSLIRDADLPPMEAGKPSLSFDAGELLKTLS